MTLFDLFPTVARLCGLATPAGVEGVDLGPLWRGEVQSVREVLYTAFDDTQRGVRDGRFKLIVYPKIGYEQLFDLQGDPFELRNLSGDPAHARPARGCGPGWRKSTRPWAIRTRSRSSRGRRWGSTTGRWNDVRTSTSRRG